MKLSRRLESIKPSATLALNARAKALAAQGLDVVSISAGEPDFDTPDFVKEAAIAAIREGFTKYTQSSGIPELRAAICDKLRRDNHLAYEPEQILVSAGGKHSIYNALQALLSDGDEAVVFSPYWVSYPDMVKLAGGRPVIVDTRDEDNWAPDPEKLRAAMTRRTRALVLNSPCNPTGAVLGRATLAAIADVVRRFPDCAVITDDIYEKLLYTKEPFSNILNVAPDLAERTVVVNGASKAYAMTGWRMGFAAGPKPLVAAMQLVQDQSTSNISSITQRAALAALTGPMDPVLEQWVAEYRARREIFVAGLNALPGIRCREPDGAFYVFPDVRGLFDRSLEGRRIGDSVGLSEVLLERFRLAAVPGTPFGADGYLRMSFCASREMIQKGLSRLRDLSGALR